MISATLGDDELMEANVYPSKPIAISERRGIIAATNTTAYALLEYYRTVIRRKMFIITDKKAAEDLGLSVSTVKKARLMLQKHNYFYTVHAKTSEIETFYYFLGVDAVIRAKYFSKLFGSDKMWEVRRRYTPETVVKAILKGNVPTVDRKDILMSLAVRARADKSQFPEWVICKEDYELLSHDLDC